MRKILGLAVVAILLVAGQAAYLAAQESEREAKPAAEKAGKEKPAAESAKPKEESSVTEHTIRIGGETIPYKATAGTILLKSDKDEPTASVFYVAYTRSDVKDLSQRPVAFLYNGGPGSSTAWLHMGAFGPKRVITTNARPTPPAPYKLEDNPNSLLDKTDLVFIDAIGTGFSHAVGKAKNKDFWGIDQDVKAFAEFINAYVSRNNRWNSPKFLIGESYGTFRSAALGNYLQSHDGMDLNGIVLISTVLDLSTISFPQGNDLPYIFYLPSYAATAWYHKVLKERPADLNAFLTQARQFASTEYADALMKGSNLGAQDKADVLKKLSYFTGLSEDYLSKGKLRINLPQFMEELQRASGQTTGRLDSRFSGPTLDLLGEYAEYDPQETAITGAFTAVLNDYMRRELKFGQDKTYLIMSESAGRAWDWKHRAGRGRGFFPGAPNVEGDLAQALTSNTHLQVQVENGLYDLATPFFATEYTMDHLGLPPELRKHIHMEYYDAGHMMYLRDESLAKLKANVASFVTSASKAE
jgi:carboxypeptidase C (cathepsin A)